METSNSEIDTKPEDTITFKRTHFYSILVVVAFAIGILTGYFVWGRSPASARAAANNPSAAQIPAATQAPRYVRYDIATDGFPSIGPADAPIVIVEFSDFQCPFCKRFQDETFKQLMAAYPGKIRFVYRHLPLTSIHPEAFPAAEASMCANEQNAFWPFHDKIFENQNKLGSDLYLQIASGLNLDTSAFEECVNANKYKDLVQTDSDFALGLGVQSTPTFFINGLALVGAQPLTAFTQVIDKELAGEIP
ncbi:MAG: hypothetical protein DCC59_06350 [Chloroflexi bacterium]|jgi:protein-disulfide isomerase|nr:DsbA family protein [Bryobacterales bacterium]RIK53739.1 MAG: hypothetical protein DCC59_06350 [Chloroflexota bacterium]